MSSVKEKHGIKKYVVNYVIITVAAVIYGASISLFLDPNDLAPGGVTGISIILNRIIGIETGTLVMMLNIPILVVGLWQFGLRFLLSTIYATIVSSVSINLLSTFEPVTRDPVLAVVVGATLLAVALGLIFRAEATTGGMDIIVKLLRRRFTHLKTGRLFLTIDVMIVSVSGFVFQNIETALYALIGVLIMSFVFDSILYSTDGGKLLYIISNHSEEIANRLLEEVDAGITFLQGKGAYSNVEKNIIMCVVRKQMLPEIEEIIKEEDPTVFYIVSNAAEIYGEGYKNLFSEKL
ncbi:MAG: YitT family protein [Eubacteriales bacterium]